MMDLRQILPLFVLPVGLMLLLVLAGLCFRRRGPIWAGLVLLWLSSTPLVSRTLTRASEGWAERVPAAEAGNADAIVVLSGGRTVAPGRAAVSEWRDPDRFFGGLELYRAGKAPLLVFTGGWVPGEPSPTLEGEILAGYARAMGVSADSVVTTGRVSNTAEEATEVAALLRGRRSTTPAAGRSPSVLLVTSAFDMLRARRLFERAGVDGHPLPSRLPGTGQRRRPRLGFRPFGRGPEADGPGVAGAVWPAVLWRLR